MLSRDRVQDLFTDVVQGIYKDACGPRTLELLGEGLTYIMESAACRDQIFRHPLGFLEVPILRMFDLPLNSHIHIWHGFDRGAVNSSIHYHAVEIKCLVASGYLQDILYDISDDLLPSHAFYRVEFGDYGSRRVRETRTCTVTKRSERIVGPGEIYKVDAFDFHSTMIDPASWPITLMVTYNPTSEPHKALGDIDGPEVEYYQHTSDLDQDTLKLILAESVGRLKPAVLPVA